MKMLAGLLLYALQVLAGGTCIYFTVKRFIEGKYFLFGTWLMCSIYSVVNLIELALMI
jgi:hypothetical protein